ncbi:hypothetical protein GW17_00007967 [Ensete ventricosum]|nr:hypothetical protein GW17_00007967 [Ensete ventricosum]
MKSLLFVLAESGVISATWTNAIACHNTGSRNKPTNTLLAEKDGRVAMVRQRFPAPLAVFGESPAAPSPTHHPMLLPYRANVLLCLLFLLAGSSRSTVSSPTHARRRRQRSASFQPTGL